MGLCILRNWYIGKLGKIESTLQLIEYFSVLYRDVKLENVLVFALDFSRIKLCDFGATTKEGLLVRKTNNTWMSFLAPEVEAFKIFIARVLIKILTFVFHSRSMKSLKMNGFIAEVHKMSGLSELFFM